MNILICCEFFHPSIGGVEKVTLELAKNFILKGNRVTVATSRFNNLLPKFQKFKKIQVIRFKIHGNYKRGIFGERDKYQEFLKKKNLI